MKKHKYISSDPSIMHGALVITGTRVPIEIILYRIKEGYTLKQIHNMYPHVSVDTLEKAIEELAQRLPASITQNDQALFQA